MRRIPTILRLAVLPAIFAIAASCNRESGPSDGGEPVESFDQDFSIGTRAGLDEMPVHGNAYTLMSYNVGGTASITNFKNQISESRQFGYYAFDDGVISGRPEGTLVPVVIRFPGASDIPPFNTGSFFTPSSGISPLVANREEGQRLVSTPAAGLNPATNQGLYRTSVIYPAIPVYQATAANLGWLAVYHIDTPIWASSPDDADGDPDTTDPFQIMVTSNAEIHPLPEPTNLFPIRSAIEVSFYSEYFKDNEPGVPQTQIFDITSLKLVNVGSNGWFNARTGIVYPNYNYGAAPTSGANLGHNWRTVYSSAEMGVNPDGTPLYPLGTYNFTDLLDPNHDGNNDDSMVVPDNVTLPPPRPGFPDPTQPIQWNAVVPVFPSDYRGAENGGLVQVKPLSLRMELSIGDAKLKATVPIALVMERNKKYNFYINVMSEIILVRYNVSPWGSGGGSDDIGGPMLDYEPVDISYGPGGWGVGGNETGDIGN